MSRSRVRRILAIVAGGFGLWIVALVVGGFFAEGCVGDRVAQRLAGSFEAQVTMGDVDLALVRGGFEARQLHIVKETGGSLSVTVDRIDAGLAPLGLALVDKRLRTLHLSGIDLQASSLAMLQARGKKGKPFAVDELVVEDVHLAVMPTAFAPALGRLEVTIERGRAGPTVLRTALSWVFSLEELVARLDLPGNVTVRLDYRDGRLKVAGGMFGATPVEVPFTIPKLDPAREMEQLKEMAVELASKLAVEQAGSWAKKQWDKIKVLPGGQ